MLGMIILMGTSIFLRLPGPVATEIAARATNVIPGPVQARVLDVIDGDTVLVLAEPWPLTFHRVRIRIADIDAPELRGGCIASKAKAASAQQFLAELLGARREAQGMEVIEVPTITLRNIRPGKYQGRMVAEIWSAAGENVGARLLVEGLAVPYNGEGARKDWC